MTKLRTSIKITVIALFATCYVKALTQ